MPILGNAPKPPLTQQNALGIISGALRLVGSLASGEVPSASEASDGLMILNQMIEAWSTDRLTVYQVGPITKDAQGNTLTLVGGKQAYLLGQNTGQEEFYLPRPARIERVSVLYSASQSTPVEKPLDPLDDVQWQAIANKSTSSLLPEAYFDDVGFPDRTLYFWPVPTQANPIILYVWGALTGFVDLQTMYGFPPGYAEAIRYNLAIRLAAEFPGDQSKLPLVIKIAGEAKARISSFNAPIKTATVDQALLAGRGRGNIYTDQPTRGSQN